MVAVKAHQAAAFLKSPAPSLSAFLFYGSDAGLIAERAHAVATLIAARSTPKGEIVRLDDADLDTNPDRLTIELTTISMFGDRKIVRASTGRRLNAQVLKPLVAILPLEGILIVEAGNLKNDDPLRVQFERSDKAAAIPCYADSAGDLDGLINDILRAASVSISADARQHLVARLGADRVLSRGEIEKLATYCGERGNVTVDDIDAVVADASELAIERIVNAAASGQRARATTEFDRALSSGESAQSVVTATERHFQRLHRTRIALDKGRPLEDALRQLKPPLFFKQKDAFTSQLRLWTAPRLLAAISKIAATAQAARRSTRLEEAQVERLLLALATMAGAERNRSGR